MENNWFTPEPVEKTLDRFCLETGSDYFDIVLLHLMTNGNLVKEKKEYMDSISEAKQNNPFSVQLSCLIQWIFAANPAIP